MNSIDDRRDGEDRRDDGWRPTLMQALAIVLMAVAGWIVTDWTTARAKMSDEIARSSQRIAVLEADMRHIRESQQRIESSLEDIRRQLQQERRR
jgi:hypothetical protein